MSHSYSAIGWNPQKRAYDLVLALGVVLYLAVFLLLAAALHPAATAETLLIRATGSAAFLLLTLVLSIGPLCRLDARFLPLLYNRRHLGVVTFLLGLVHGAFSLFQFHALGDRNPFVSLLISNTHFASLADFPFQLLGFLALIILFLMAATSHDFWLRNLTPPVWKTLHMLVYLSYALLVAHITLGLLQSERSPALVAALSVSVALVVTLHLAAARAESRSDAARHSVPLDSFVRVCPAAEIPDRCARVVSIQGERIAVFRNANKISAVSNVCRHQNGPLGEGRIVDGCITCPWHGYQYLPESGAAPAPFTEKVSTFRSVVRDGVVWIDPRPLPPGTFVPPAFCPPEA